MPARRRPHALYTWTKAVERPVEAVRTHLREALIATGVHDEPLDDALVMASELASNAHAYAPGPYELRLHTTSAELIVEVHDRGLELPPLPPEPVTELFTPQTGDRGCGTDALLARLSEHGRGLMIIHQLSQGCWGFRLRPGGKVAWYAIPR